MALVQAAVKEGTVMVRKQGNDSEEQRVIDDVREFGWHIVGIESEEDKPAFAYSIGMQHTLGHPEIVVTGLDDSRTMAQIINTIGELVRDGARFQAGQETDQILEGYPCTFRTVPESQYSEYFGYALWFYALEPFHVLQCVWPDAQRRYPWTKDCAAEIRACQPILADSAGWLFDAGRDTLAFTTRGVLDGTQPIRVVSHDSEGEWQFLCGTTTDAGDGRLVSLGTIISLHPSVAELGNLPERWQAIRDSPSDAWRRIKS